MRELEEAVALALYNRYRERLGMRPVDYIGANATPAAERCREDARDALAVVRERMGEPTEAMWEAFGADIDWEVFPGYWSRAIAASPLGDST